MDERKLTRRKVLAGMGAVGLASAGSVVVDDGQLFASHSSYTYATAVPDTGKDGRESGALKLQWRETYNGQPIEREAITSPTADSRTLPSISIPNALPGDSGTVQLRASVPQTERGRDPKVCVSLELRLLELDEGDQTEPERDAEVDQTLDEAVDITVWYDVGTFRTDTFFPCNGRRDAGEPVLASGTLSETAETLSPAAGESAVNVECLTPDDALCLGLSWHLDEGVGNAVQTDRTTFAFDVTIESTEGLDS